MAIKIFFCYAHEDEALLNTLKKHLRPLQRQGLIDMWYDRDISAGTEWEPDIILLLISPDFMDSDYCYGIEMKRALERHEQHTTRVIPIILRPTYWQGILGKLQAIPKNAIPVVNQSWHSQDDAFHDIEESIRTIVEELPEKQRLSLPQKAKEQWEEGDKLYNKKLYSKAIISYTKALSLDPTNAAIYANRGSAYVNIGENQKAIADCTKALSLIPTYTQAYNNRGGAYMNIGENQKAIADFDQALTLDPNDTDIKKRREEAVRQLKGQ